MMCVERIEMRVRRELNSKKNGRAGWQRMEGGWYSGGGRGRGVKIDGCSREIERPNEEF
jgi:hypothetical protein